MRRIGIVTAIVMAVLLTFQFNTVVFAEELASSETDAAITNGCHSIDATSAYLGTQKLTDNVTSAIAYELNSDTLMYTWNADSTVFPSSLVKILTALLAIEQGDLQATVTVTQSALDSVPYYAASAELLADEQMSLSDLLYCMMVGSANDAAAVIAEHISGSQTAFVEQMNAFAAEMGCTGTQFTNVHGLHDEQQYSTVRDLLRILSRAVKNEQFLQYFSAVDYVVPATNKSDARELSSSNLLMNAADSIQLYLDSRVIGGRTGITDDGARCLATLAEHNGMKIICIVTGSESTFAEDGNTLTYGSFDETSKLLDACLNGYQVAQILYKDQVMHQCDVPNGANDVILSANETAYSVLPAEVTVQELSYRYGDLQQLAAPISAGQVVSNVQVWHGGFCIAESDLIAVNSVSVSQQSSNTQEDISKNSAQSIAVTILVIIGVLACVLFLVRGIRWLRMYLDIRRGRKYRRSRRRSK